jgi:hypothetical protein
MPGLLVRSVADVGHDHAASLELPPHAGVNTLGAPPALLRGEKATPLRHGTRTTAPTQAWAHHHPLECHRDWLQGVWLPHLAHIRLHSHLHRHLAVALMALEARRPLLHALHFHQRLHHSDKVQARWAP